jgi:hypothetical protein
VMELSFREKTPSFPLKYQTSPIPNIIDQLVFITRNIYHHKNNCCSLSSKTLFPKFTKLSHIGLVETSFMLTFDLWPLTLTSTYIQTIFFHMTLPTVEGIYSAGIMNYLHLTKKVYIQKFSYLPWLKCNAACDIFYDVCVIHCFYAH